MKILVFFEVKKTGQYYSMHLKSMTDFYRIKEDKGLRIKDMASVIDQSTGQTLERREYESDREIATVRISRTQEEIMRSASIDEMEDIQEYTGEDKAYNTDKLSKKIAAAGTTVEDFKEEVDIITKKLFGRESESEPEEKQEPKDLSKSDIDNALKEIKRREMRFVKREAQLEEKLDVMTKKFEDMENIVNMFVGEVLFHRETIAEDTKMYAEKEKLLWEKITEITTDNDYTKTQLSHHQSILKLMDSKLNTKNNWIKKLLRKQG